MGERKPGRNLMRAQVGGGLPLRIFNIIFALAFAAVVLLVLLWNPGGYLNSHWLWLALAAFLGCVIALLASRLFLLLPKPGPVPLAVVTSVLFVVLIFVQVLVCAEALPAILANKGVLGPVFTSAEAFALTGRRAGEYFIFNPAQTGMYSLLCGYFSLLHLFGVTQFVIPMMALNMVAVCGSLLLLFFCANRLFGGQKALFTLAVCLFTLPLSLDVPFCSAELLALPFPIAAVVLWLRTRQHWRSGNFRRAMVGFVLISALLALGGLIKTAVLVVWIALALDLLILLCGRGRALVLLAGLAAAGVVFLGGGYLLRNTSAMPLAVNGEGMPKTAGILMGLKGTGGYDAQVYESILEQEGKAQKASYINNEIAKTAAEYGVVGTFEHFGNKLSHTFGNGAYGASALLGAVVPPGSVLGSLFVSGGRYYGMVSYATYALRVALLFWLTVATVKSVYRKNNALTFIRVALFGMLLFQLIWESEARYTICFLPLFILGAVEAAPVVPAAKTAGERPAHAQDGNGGFAPAGDVQTDLVALPQPPADDLELFGDDAEQIAWQEAVPADWVPPEAQLWDGLAPEQEADESAEPAAESVPAAQQPQGNTGADAGVQGYPPGDEMIPPASSPPYYPPV